MFKVSRDGEFSNVLRNDPKVERKKAVAAKGAQKWHRPLPITKGPDNKLIYVLL